MMIIVMSAVLLALTITGIVTVLFIASSTSSRRFELIHWLGAALCVAVTSVFIAGAIGLGKAAKQVDRSADVASALGSRAFELVRDYLPGNEITSWISEADDNVVPQIESVRALLHRKFRRAIIWSAIVTVALNLLYLLLLTTARKSSGTSSGSDGFDDLDSDITNLGNFDSCLDDDFS